MYTDEIMKYYELELGQALVLDKPSDTTIVPYAVKFVDGHVQLALQQSQPMINYALENYAHRNSFEFLFVIASHLYLRRFIISLAIVLEFGSSIQIESLKFCVACSYPRLVSRGPQEHSLFVQDHWGLGLCFKQTSCGKNPETFPV